jgi:hypothetical protein
MDLLAKTNFGPGTDDSLEIGEQVQGKKDGVTVRPQIQQETGCPCLSEPPMTLLQTDQGRAKRFVSKSIKGLFTASLL